MEERDVYQERYTKHIATKLTPKEPLAELSKQYHTNLKRILNHRKSYRAFKATPVDRETREAFLSILEKVPSSCNRKAVYTKSGDPKVLEQYLVGGRGWLTQANKIYLIFAARKAYKSPNETGFMPYLDAGAVLQNGYLAATTLNIGCCYINPNIREHDREDFNKIYNPDDDYFCGALAIGHIYK